MITNLSGVYNFLPTCQLINFKKYCEKASSKYGDTEVMAVEARTT